MKIDFIDQFPRKRAYPKLNEVMRFGKDRLAMAFAFCTKSGIALLRNHIENLRQPNSFLVVSYNPPTNFNALGEIHKKAPYSLYLHFGAEAPYEYNIGAPIMHSKVLYAESKGKAMLWVGSHNLTGNAMLGLNHEAALLIEGDKEEQVFKDALRHLEACRESSELYDPGLEKGESPVQKTDVLIIHAGCKEVPEKDLKWNVRLLLSRNNYDHMFSTPADVRLYLHCIERWSEIDLANPTRKYQGKLTGKNLTERNERGGMLGRSAEWRDVHFNIIERSRGLWLVDNQELPKQTKTQVVFTLDRQFHHEEMYFSHEPGLGVHLTALGEEEELVHSESDMFKNYKPSHVINTSLRYWPLGRSGNKFSVLDVDVKRKDLPAMKKRLEAYGVRDVSIEKAKKRSKMHPNDYIKRAKYIL